MIKALKEYWFWWLIPVLVTYFLLYPVKKNGFVDFDDGLYVTQNTYLLNQNSCLTDYFSPKAVVAGNYHPLTMLSLAMDHYMGGTDPSCFHSTNLLLHTLNTFGVFLLVFFVLHRQALTACFVSLVFGIHPMHIESVAWISERKDVLYVFFFLASILLFYKYKKTKNKVFYAVSIILFVCSILSKGMAVTLPLILLLMDWYKGEKLTGKVLWEKAPYFILSLLAGILTFYIQHTSKTLADDHLSNLIQLLSNSCYAILLYLLKFILPIKLSVYHVYPELYNHSFIYPTDLYWAPVFFLLFVWGIYFVRKNKVLLFGLAFFYVSVFLVSQIIPFGSTIISERYTYLAYIGLAFPPGVWISNAHHKLHPLYKFRILFYILTTIWLIGFSFQSYKRIAVWKNSDSLWADAIQKLEKPAVYPYHAHASYLTYRSGIDIDKPNQVITAEDYRKAITEMKIVISMDPKEQYLAELAYDYGFSGQHDSCSATFDRLIRLNPKNKLYYTNKALSQHYLKNLSGEFETYSHALMYFSDDPQLLSERAQLGIELNQSDSVIKDAQKLIRQNTHSSAGYLYLGLAYQNKECYQKALDNLLIAEKLRPENAEQFFQLAIVYFKMGDKTKAKEYLKIAVSKGYQLEPQYRTLFE